MQAMIYICIKCQSIYPRFQIFCTDCGAWESLEQQLRRSIMSGAAPIALSKVKSVSLSRTKTNITQVDTLLDGGFVRGCSVLLSGPPGAGKSTLVMQVLKSMNIPSLYVTGEEPVQQLKLRTDRL